MYEIMKDKRGFIAALDQSGGSSSKTLKAYGIPETAYNTEEEMFDLIHEMRKRVFTSKSFTNEHIIGAILFEKTMLSKVNGEFTADYLWNEKKIVSFLKVDKGLAEQNNGVKLMKPIPELETELKEAVEKHVFGTKMRSFAYTFRIISAFPGVPVLQQCTLHFFSDCGMPLPYQYKDLAHFLRYAHNLPPLPPHVPGKYHLKTGLLRIPCFPYIFLPCPVPDWRNGFLSGSLSAEIPFLPEDCPVLPEKYRFRQDTVHTRTDFLHPVS